MTFEDLSKLSSVWKDAEFKVIYIKMFDRADRGGNCEKKITQSGWLTGLLYWMVNWNFQRQRMFFLLLREGKNREDAK